MKACLYHNRERAENAPRTRVHTDGYSHGGGIGCGFLAAFSRGYRCEGGIVGALPEMGPWYGGASPCLVSWECGLRRAAQRSGLCLGFVGCTQFNDYPEGTESKPYATARQRKAYITKSHSIILLFNSMSLDSISLIWSADILRPCQLTFSGFCQLTFCNQETPENMPDSRHEKKEKNYFSPKSTIYCAVSHNPTHESTTYCVKRIKETVRII